MPLSKSPAKPNPNQPRLHHEWSFEAIGTQFWIGLYQPCSAVQLMEVQSQITERIEEFDQTYSRFRDDSLVAQIARQAGSYELPSDADKLITFYGQLYDATDGRVTPLIGQALADAGYDADYSLIPGEVKPVPLWHGVCSYKNGHLTVTQPVLLDFGAAGKGYLVDLLADILRGAGIAAFCIDGSGDLICRGLSEPLRIGLENPHDFNQVIGVAHMQNGALCGSSGSRRQWAGYTHILDPVSLESPHQIAAVWAVADSCMLADGLATALYFSDPQTLNKKFNFSYLKVNEKNQADYSDDFPAELFIVKDNHV